VPKITTIVSSCFRLLEENLADIFYRFQRVVTDVLISDVGRRQNTSVIAKLHNHMCAFLQLVSGNDVGLYGRHQNTSRLRRLMIGLDGDTYCSGGAVSRYAALVGEMCAIMKLERMPAAKGNVWRNVKSYFLYKGSEQVG